MGPNSKKRAWASERSRASLSTEPTAIASTPRTGRAALWVAVIAAIALAFSLAILYPHADTSTAAQPEASRASPSSSAANSSARHLAPGETNPIAPTERAPAAADANENPLDKKRFEGRGRLRGVVATDPPNSGLSSGTKLILRPSKVFVGTGATEVREIELAPDGRFALEDLPLGGYELSIDSIELDAPHTQVLLAKPDTQDLFVRIVAFQGGAIDGRAFESNGAGADGLAIVLQDTASGATWTAKCAIGGAFRFEHVHEANYRVFAGTAEVPLVPPLEVVFKRPHATLPDIQLPPLSELDVETVDVHGAPLAKAEITGFGSKSGALRATTGDDGKVRVRFLPAGDYDVFAQIAKIGRQKQRVALALDEPAVVRFVFHP